jgi:nucleotide-binding universal stress UspA family protein
MTVKKIIVGYDSSPHARAAAAWALDEAARTGALVEFFYAYEWPSWAPAISTGPAPAVWPDGETERAVKGALNEAVIDARHSHPEVRTDVSIVNAGAAVTLIERSAEASLVVVGSRGHSAVAGLGSVSVAVSAHAHCPVIVVRGTPAATAPVVVGLDDSPAARLALGFAFEQAAAREVTLRVIQAWSPLVGVWSTPPVLSEAVLTAQQRVLSELGKPWREKYPKVEVTYEIITEHPASALTLAGTGAQLLVVGTRGRGAVRGMLLGSVSQHLLHHCACTVAVIHEMPAA